MLVDETPQLNRVTDCAGRLKKPPALLDINNPLSKPCGRILSATEDGDTSVRYEAACQIEGNVFRFVPLGKEPVVPFTGAQVELDGRYDAGYKE
jgi:hypothetical protein